MANKGPKKDIREVAAQELSAAQAEFLCKLYLLRKYKLSQVIRILGSPEQADRQSIVVSQEDTTQLRDAELIAGEANFALTGKGLKLVEAKFPEIKIESFESSEAEMLRRSIWGGEIA